MGWVHNSLFYRLQTLYSLKSLQFNTVAWRHIAQDICAKFVTRMPHSQWWKDALDLHNIQVGHPLFGVLKVQYIHIFCHMHVLTKNEKKCDSSFEYAWHTVCSKQITDVCDCNIHILFPTKPTQPCTNFCKKARGTEITGSGLLMWLSLGCNS